MGGDDLLYQHVGYCARVCKDEVKGQSFKYSALSLDQNA